VDSFRYMKLDDVVTVLRRPVIQSYIKTDISEKIPIGPNSDTPPPKKKNLADYCFFALNFTPFPKIIKMVQIFSNLADECKVYRGKTLLSLSKKSSLIRPT